jgi:hypothetical protein
MKLRSFQKKCVCQMEVGTAKNFNLLKLRDSGKFIDKILQSSSNDEISVHCMVMASLSPTFSKLMESDHITSIPYQKEVVDVLVMFAYTGSCELKEEFAEKTMEAAKEYEIEALVKICGDFLISTLTERNALRLFRISVKHCCMHVSSSISKFICLNFKSFIADGQAVDLTMEELSVFIKIEELQMKEEELHKFIQVWADANSFTKSQLQDIIKWIPLKRRPAKVVLSVGGWSSHSNDTMEVYDDLSSTWSISSIKLPIDSAHHGAVEIEDNLYIAGGYSRVFGYLDRLHCLNMSTMVWMEMSPMMSKRCFIATATLGGKLYALGGQDGSSSLQTVEMYDPKTNMWTEMPSMLQRRSSFGVVVFEGKIFAIGGFDGQDVLTSVEYFCPVEGKWAISSPLSTPRLGLRAVVMEERIFVLGGNDGTERLSSVECFRPGMTRTTWYLVPDMLHRMSHFATCVLEGKLMVAGGSRVMVEGTTSKVCREVDLYWPKENKWTAGPSMNIKKWAFDCVLLGSGNLSI